jgi:hypothetical protein
MWWLATAVETWQPFDAAELNFRNTVLANCRAGANQYGRAYAVMYDLSGLKPGQIDSIIADWKLLPVRQGCLSSGLCVTALFL